MLKLARKRFTFPSHFFLLFAINSSVSHSLLAKYHQRIVEKFSRLIRNLLLPKEGKCELVVCCYFPLFHLSTILFCCFTIFWWRAAHTKVPWNDFISRIRFVTKLISISSQSGSKDHIVSPINEDSQWSAPSTSQHLRNDDNFLHTQQQTTTKRTKGKKRSTSYNIRNSWRIKIV